MHGEWQSNIRSGSGLLYRRAITSMIFSLLLPLSFQCCLDPSSTYPYICLSSCHYPYSLHWESITFNLNKKQPHTQSSVSACGLPWGPHIYVLYMAHLVLLWPASYCKVTNFTVGWKFVSMVWNKTSFLSKSIQLLVPQSLQQVMLAFLFFWSFSSTCLMNRICICFTYE